jgi:hypothetical protein
MISMRAILAGAAAALAFGAAGAVQAAVIDNGSFEDIVVDWAANPALVQTPGEFEHRNASGVADKLYKPKDGVLLGVIQANPNTTPNTITQTFTTIGGLFSGFAAFLGEDDIGNDYGFVRLYEGADTTGVFTELFYADIDGVGDFGYTEWTGFSKVIGKGVYTLQAGVANGSDGFLPSFLLVDKFRVSEVPEPSTWALMLTGFLGLGVMLRRRRAGGERQFAVVAVAGPSNA